MTDNLLQALNPPGGRRTPEQVERIITRHLEIYAEPLTTWDDKAAIFAAWIEENMPCKLKEGDYKTPSIEYRKDIKREDCVDCKNETWCGLPPVKKKDPSQQRTLL